MKRSSSGLGIVQRKNSTMCRFIQWKNFVGNLKNNKMYLKDIESLSEKKLEIFKKRKNLLILRKKLSDYIKKVRKMSKINNINK